MLTTTRAIVLRTVKYSDNSFIADFFTEELGRMEALVHISHSRKAAMKKQLFQPTMQLELSLDYREKASLQHLRSVRISRAYTTITFDAGKLSQALFCAEFLIYATRSERQAKALFNYVSDSLAWLDEARENTANFHLVFMLHLSRFIGFFPNLEDYHKGDYFDLREACFTRTMPFHHDFLKPDEAATISVLMRMNYQNMHLFLMNRVQRNRITDIIVTYYRLHLPQMSEMNSIGVLKELFA